jgi:hypothetical protein
MPAKRKTVTMLVTVTVPADKSPQWARKEVRHLINDGSGYHTYAGEEVKCRGVRSAKT